jgi:hypothetical protein
MRGAFIWPPLSTPTSLPPNGAAGGDLAGSYPDPTVPGLPVSEFWYPPAVAHPNDVEGVTTSIGPFTWRRTSDWASITPVGVVPTSLSNPAASTFRVAFNSPRSWITVQPARGYSIALHESFAAGARPSSCMFKLRAHLPIVQAGNIGQTAIGWALAADLAGVPDALNLGQFTLTQVAATQTQIQTYFRNAGAFQQNAVSVVLQQTPFDLEMILLVIGTQLTLLANCNGMIHRCGQLSLAGFGSAVKTHVYQTWNSIGDAASDMPGDPVFRFDYARQLDSGDIALL